MLTFASPFVRTFRAILQSSFTTLNLYILVYSTNPPVSVCSTIQIFFLGPSGFTYCFIEFSYVADSVKEAYFLNIIRKGVFSTSLYFVQTFRNRLYPSSASVFGKPWVFNGHYFQQVT
jgi:hypothetical protein